MAKFTVDFKPVNACLVVTMVVGKYLFKFHNKCTTPVEQDVN